MDESSRFMEIPGGYGLGLAVTGAYGTGAGWTFTGKDGRPKKATVAEACDQARVAYSKARDPEEGEFAREVIISRSKEALKVMEGRYERMAAGNAGPGANMESFIQAIAAFRGEIIEAESGA